MTHRRPRALTAGVKREDLLMVSISLVKGGRSHGEPGDFVSDVALTLQALEGRTRQGGNFEAFPATAASSVSGSESWHMLGPLPAGWPVAS
jgi:hypothetical protein